MNKKLYALLILLSASVITTNYAATISVEKAGPATVIVGNNLGYTVIKHTYSVFHRDHEEGFYKLESFYYVVQNGDLKKINREDYLNKKKALYHQGIGTLVKLKEGKDPECMNFLEKELLPSCTKSTGSEFAQCLRNKSSKIATELKEEQKVISNLKTGLVKTDTTSLTEKIKIAELFAQN